MVDLRRANRGESNSIDYTGEDPIRAELFSVERLEQYAHSLAAEHRTVKKKGRARLLPRLEDNGRKLVIAYRALVEAVRKGESMSPAAEWLLDNFHIVEEQLREIREDLPKGYYNELPKLGDGDFADHPRIYVVALALIAHTDSRLDPATLKRFIIAYQSVSALTIGELWAVAISLRLALVENLRRLATQIVRWRSEKDEADHFADKLLELTATQGYDPVSLVADRFERWDRIHRAFTVQLMQRLRDQDTSITPVFDWIEKQLQRQGNSIEHLMHGEHQRQAAAQVTVGNIITSMRLLSTLDWRDFFEKVSLIEPILGQDPTGSYANMEFASRDRYRHVIEKISKRTNVPEVEIAKATVDLARKSASGDSSSAGFESHVGYFLIDSGKSQLESAFNYRPRIGERIARWVLRHPTFVYLGTLTFLTVLMLAFLGIMLSRQGGSWPVMILMGILALLPASDLALSVLNFDITHVFEPRVLPRMDTSEGIPANARTLVVVPTIISNLDVVEKLIEKLEVLFLANQDNHIHFAILSDFSDATEPELPEDEPLLEAALAGIERLNSTYGKGLESGWSRFYFFHRRRLWNPGEEKWMGWERKRGKLHELNQLIRGQHDTSFIVQTGDTSRLKDVRFVITLDSDTQLPRDVARRLIGTALHPLNRPVLDSKVNRLRRGYGILQPRVSVSLLSSCESRFAGIFSGNTGIDPYTTAVSDVYQDLFGEGSYTGKGLYEVDSFEQTLASRVPENTLLSHDLFESLFARAALVTDIELLDDYPPHYDTYAKRQHRWTRGDWQIVAWMGRHVPDDRGRKVRNVLPLISRWKIFDNLRRSLTAPAIVLWLLASWTIFPGSPWLWSLVVLVTMAFPAYLHVTTGVMTHPRGIPWTSHFWGVWGGLRTNTAQFALTFTFIAHQAYLMIDAIALVLYRGFISHKGKLEWVTAADAEKASNHNLSSMIRFMWPVIPLTLGAFGLILWMRPGAADDAAPFLAAWLASPLVAWWVSRRADDKRVELGDEEVRFARLIARRTWRFFETFVGAEDNWLPPDNFQEDPTPVVAHRTSPTNIGLLLISTAAAYDLGYVGALELIERQELTFVTLAKMQKFRGHFFNWYDTRSLEPLLPQYISTVDSGNLAGHLIALKQMCIELQDKPIFSESTIQGLADTIELISEESTRLGTIRQRTEVITIKHLREEIETCKRLVSAQAPTTLTSWATLFDALSRRAGTIEDIVGALTLEHGAESFTDLSWWISALRHQLRGLRRDLTTVVPWAEVRTIDIDTLVQSASTAAQERWTVIKNLIDQNLPLSEVSQRCDDLMVELAALLGELESVNKTPVGLVASSDLKELAERIQSAPNAANDLLVRLRRLAQRCDELFHEMNFSFLLDKDRELFTIGYNVAELKPDNSYYDLLASEARLASFISIGKGDVPQDHWFRLGRQLTLVHRSRALISWTGTMFEYLMPMLVMNSYSSTLLDQTHRAVVRRQIEYGEERGVPWGISESAYNARDLNLNYQYAPFGVPGLGLKRGLVQDLVVAPYATMLAARVDAAAAISNLLHLRREGALGRYGYYESIDYTSDRLPQNQRLVLIRAFMAHHQGMSLVALDNVLHNGRMESRFHADPLVRATDLLLQERIPQGVPATRPRAEEVLIGRVARDIAGSVARIYLGADQSNPRTQLLTNGNYHVMMTAAGSGYSLCAARAVTRWREDVTRDNWGTFIYLRDIQSGAVWSAGQQPVNRKPTSYEATFAEDKVDFWREDAGFVTHTQIVVSPEVNAEVRQVTISNNTSRTSEIELTSYAEVVLAPPAADAAHPAFGNLFIETEFLHPHNALLAHRRQYSGDEDPIWGVHVVMVERSMIGAVQYETDRGRFLGRGHTVSEPVAVMEERPLSNTVGAVLDPVFSLRCRIRLQPNESASVTFTTAVARSRDEAITLADKYHDPNTCRRA